MAGHRPVWADIDLTAIRHNTGVMARLVAPARLCAVVKAWAYGHDPVRASRAALAGGAEWLAVALVAEGVALREAGILAPILVLSEPPLDAMADVVAFNLVPTIYTAAGLDAAVKAVAAAGAQPLTVHVKVDTGMHRVGADPAEAVALAVAAASRPELSLGGVSTHFAVADDASDPFTAEQIRRFAQVVDTLAKNGIRPPLVHAANSAGAVAFPAGRGDMVRCGITLYGVAPNPAMAMAAVVGLRPALSLKARVSYVKEVEAGEGVSYGLSYRCDRRSVVATVPVGYADGVPWRLGQSGGQVLVGGRRCAIAGSVTMDQLMIDCGPGGDVAVGDEVVLLGRQGDEEIGAWEWAERIGTIAYEVLCGISSRVPRRYIGG